MNRPKRIKGLVTVACAADFLWKQHEQLKDDMKRNVEKAGYFELKSPKGNAPYHISFNCVLDAKMNSIESMTKVTIIL